MSALQLRRPGDDIIDADETIPGVLDEFEGFMMCDAHGADASLAKGSVGAMRYGEHVPMIGSPAATH